MKCAMNYCIYNKDDLCILVEIEIDSVGLCQECIMVSIADMDLHMLKQRQLRKIEKKHHYQ